MQRLISPINCAVSPNYTLKHGYTALQGISLSAYWQLDLPVVTLHSAYSELEEQSPSVQTVQ